VVPSTYVRDGDDAVMVEVETDQYVSQRNLGANGKPIRRGRPGQFAKTPDEVAEPAVAVQRGGRERIIPFSKWSRAPPPTN
jgi:hypothetical protein